MTKTERARDYLARFPNTNKTAIARLMSKEHKAQFNNEEDARAALRYATGAQGKKNRKQVPAGDVKLGKAGDAYNPYNLPEQQHNNNRPNVIKVEKGMRMGLLSDIHLPYQDNEALTLALDKIKDNSVDIVYLNGDVIDAYEISSFERDPSKKNFAAEIDIARNFLQAVRAKFPTQAIYFKEGNHEARLTMFLRRKAPELLGFEVLKLEKLLHLKDFGIIHVPSKVITKYGKINVIHGHEFAKGVTAPVNPARGFFMKGKSNVIGGHHHQDSAHSENTLGGKQLVAYSTGHLADPAPEYHPHNNWSQGFAEIEITGNKGEFVVSKYKILGDPGTKHIINS